MLNWRGVLANDLLPLVACDESWRKLIQAILSEDLTPVGIHLAIFVEPYLQYILEGTKTVESRFGMRRTAPYGQVAVGDVILLKRSGGPLLGVCQVSEVWFYHLDRISWRNVKKEFAQSLCAQDPGFWEQRKRASFVTLMRLSSVLPIKPVTFPKQDRRGWVILRNPTPANYKGATLL